MSFSIQAKGLDYLLDYIIDTFFVDGENYRLEQIFSSDMEPTETDINTWLEWKLNQQLEAHFETFIPFIEYGPHKDWVISDKDIETLTRELNEKLSAEQKYAYFGIEENDRILTSDIGKYFEIYLDTCISAEFDWYDLTRYISYN